MAQWPVRGGQPLGRTIYWKTQHITERRENELNDALARSLARGYANSLPEWKLEDLREDSEAVKSVKGSLREGG